MDENGTHKLPQKGQHDAKPSPKRVQRHQSAAVRRSLDRLDRYLDWMEVHQQQKLSRNHVLRLALTQWLEAEEAKGAMTHPDVLRERFHTAYTSLRRRKDAVAIHRLRHLLNWPADRFDAVLEHLRAESEVVLHRGDPSRLSDEERRLSYKVNGQLYLTLAWQD